MLAALLLVASPALMLAPPAAASAHRLAQPVMQFGALGGQTPFAPLGTAGGASSAAASGSSALGQSEVAATGEVVKKGKKRKVDPNTGMLDQDRHSPDNSGVSHVPVPSPYHVFEPRMVRSPSAAPCTMHPAPCSTLWLAPCSPRGASHGALDRAAHEHHRPPPPPALLLHRPPHPTQATPGYSDATRPPPRTPEEQVLAQPVAQPVLAGPSPLSLANTAAAAAPKGRGGDLGATTWAGSGDLGGTKATTRAPARRSGQTALQGQTAASRVVTASAL